MEKSIETIWKEGFLKDNELSTPKLNNLYNQKSQLVLEKIKRAMKIDNKGLIPLAILCIGGFSYTGYFFIGFYLMFLMMGLFFLNRNKIRELEKINIELDNYHYLLAYRTGIKKMVKFYIRLLGFGLPVVVLPGYWLFFRNTEMYQEFISETEMFIVLVILLLTIVISVMGIFIYWITTKMIYGNLLKKLDGILKDMEALKE